MDGEACVPPTPHSLGAGVVSTHTTGVPATPTGSITCPPSRWLPAAAGLGAGSRYSRFRGPRKSQDRGHTSPVGVGCLSGSHADSSQVRQLQEPAWLVWALVGEDWAALASSRNLGLQRRAGEAALAHGAHCPSLFPPSLKPQGPGGKQWLDGPGGHPFHTTLTRCSKRPRAAHHTPAPCPSQKHGRLSAGVR